MYIKAYRSIAFQKTEIYETDVIYISPDTDEIDDEFTDGVKYEQLRTMCNFEYFDEKHKECRWIAIPWEFVISISDEYPKGGIEQ